MLALSLSCSAALAQRIQGDFDLYGQVREGDQTRDSELPADFYGDLRLSGLPHAGRVETFFRLNRDFALDEGAADFYAGSASFAGIGPGLGMTVGRQWIGEVSGDVFVADAGKLEIDPGWPVSFTFFGGQPQYFEPTVSSENLSQDEILWGGSMRASRWTGGSLNLGFLQHEREDKVLRQLVSLSGRQSFLSLPGLPDVYGTVAYDADHQNIDQATLGTNVVLPLRFLLNTEATYYKPQDQGERLTTNLDRREDAIFEAFSISEMLQFRGGLRVPLTRNSFGYADYSYQRYESLPGDFQNGHVAAGGLGWHPGGDGLERVRLEYYLVDSEGGNINGGRAYYENDVYERLRFRSAVDVTGIEKVTNESEIAVHTLLGLGYVVFPGLICEVDFEANRNQRFDEDFRFGFIVSYDFGWRRHHVRESEKEES